MHRDALHHGFHASPGPLAEALHRHVPAAAHTAAALWAHDPAAWSSDEAVQQKIAKRLGWLGSPALMAGAIGRIRTFAERVKADGFTDVVLLGMGGSSLAPEVLRAVLGIAPGWPMLHRLDSTDPAAIRAVDTPPATTLFLLSSKSGTTIEPNSLAAHFRQVLEKAGLTWADHFVAITDPRTELALRADRERFRDVFINPADIGGRYSALSFFGLVPAALMGQNIDALLTWGIALLDEAQVAGTDLLANPAIGLGLLMGTAALEGRDKVTLVLPPSFEALGPWVEQLVAESAGKQGVGIVPIAGEALGLTDVYGPDRLFVQLHVVGETSEDDDAAVRALGRSAPLARIDLIEREAIGAEFMRWEIATAVAGALLGINPFDEPDVAQAKDATRVLLDRRKKEGRLPVAAGDITLPGGATLTATTTARDRLAGSPVAAILTLVEPGDYVALLAYLGPDPELADVLAAFRRHARNRTLAATMFGYGPRYLHSTGQLHKGGPNTGVFVLVSATPVEDLAIPGEPFTFGTLELAQVLGDFASLDATGRRAVHIHLPSPDVTLLTEALGALERSA